MSRRLALAILLLALPLSAQDLLVSTDWLQANLPKVRVVDVGDRATYDAGHIPGAVLVELSSILTKIDSTPNELPPIDKLEAVFRGAGVGERQRIVLYSRDPINATRAWFTLDYLGHGFRTALLDGGFAKWKAEGRAVSTQPATPAASTFQAKVHLAALARLTAVHELVQSRGGFGSNLVLIDARPFEQFTGKEAGLDVKCPGHIPGAVNIPWSMNLTTGEPPVFRSVADLRAMYEDAGVTKTSANIVYCRTGMLASMTYFTLKYIGYDATLYDGSFIEWSNRGETVE